MSDLNAVISAIEGIEAKIAAFATKAEAEAKSAGTVAHETKSALDNLGIEQRKLADELLALKQKGIATPEIETGAQSWGEQFIKSAEYTGKLDALVGNRKFGSIGLEVKNTLTGSDVTVSPDRKPGVVGGAFAPLTMESLFTGVPTSSNAIEYTRENVFTNNAAEAAEGAVKAESSLTFTLENMPIATVAHWIKISRQLAADNAALAAYVDLRMRFGVNRRVETQLVSGNGTAPNMKGFMAAGNYTAHGYAAAGLGATLQKLVLIRKMIGDLEAAGLNPNAIVLNPADWAQVEIDIFTANTNLVAFRYDTMGRPVLFGRNVVTPVGMTADTVAVGDFAMAGAIHNREGVVVEMSESDSDNFTKNLITLRAERRLALAIEMPAAIRAGDLTPA